MNIAIGNTFLHTSAPYSTSDVRSGKNEFGGMLSALRPEDNLRELTDKQIEDLKERFDVENLREEAYYNLLVKLVDMNVISEDNFNKLLVKKASQEAEESEDMASSGSSDSFEARYKDYLDKFVKDSELYEHFFRVIREEKSSVRDTNVAETLEFCERQKEYGERIEEAIQSIKREEERIPDKR